MVWGTAHCQSCFQPTDQCVCVCVSGKVNDFCLNGTISAIGIGGAGSLFFPLMLHLDDLW